MLGTDTDLQLSDRDLTRIVRLVYDRSGITLHDGKRALVIARLQKRLRVLGLDSFQAYVTRVEQDTSGDEVVALLDAIATNHTYFFREEQHFEFLTSTVVPAWRARAGAAALSVWSAACSTGEEPYTIVMSLLRGDAPPRLHVLASDISTKALRAAKTGVYKLASVQSLPREILRAYFERGQGEQAGLARVCAEVRRPVTFRRLNLLELGPMGETFDVIFCRNVMIYFDKLVQQRVVEALERHLRPGGYLFIAHSESLSGLRHDLRWAAPAVYQKEGA